MPSRTVAELVRHFVAHAAGSTLEDIAEKLRLLTDGVGSASALSAWQTGQRRPKINQIRALRKVVQCECRTVPDEAIVEAYRHPVPAKLITAGRRPVAQSPVPILLGDPVMTPHRPAPHIVGRDGEVQDFVHLHADQSGRRLVNIFGPGGIGKTEVFHKFVGYGRKNLLSIAYADVAEIRHSGDRPYACAEILRSLDATLDRAELEPFRRQLREYDIAMAAVRAAGGPERFFDLRPPALTEIWPDAAGPPSRQLRDAVGSRVGFDQYRRRAPANLTSSFFSGVAAIEDVDGRAITLLLDTYEEIAELDDWVCREVVPHLPANTGLVMFGRHQLTKVNIDWADHQDMLRARPLPELTEDEAKSYLAHYGLNEAAALAGVYAVTGGYPLLLVLARTLAEESGGWAAIGELERDRDRDLIASRLLDRILREKRIRGLQEVLETCSIAPWIEPGVIGALLNVPPADAHRLYTELAMHSLVSRHPHGVALHDKIRELLQTRLRFASEIRYRELTRALSSYLAGRGGVAHA